MANSVVILLALALSVTQTHDVSCLQCILCIMVTSLLWSPHNCGNLTIMVTSLLWSPHYCGQLTKMATPLLW